MSFNVTQLSSPLLQSSKASMVNISKANSSFLTSSGISSSSRPKKHLTCFVTVTPKRLTDTNGSIENSVMFFKKRKSDWYWTYDSIHNQWLCCMEPCYKPAECNSHKLARHRMPKRQKMLQGELSCPDED